MRPATISALRYDFAANRCARHAPQQRQLADVSERVGNRRLEQALEWDGNRGAGLGRAVQRVERGVEAPDLTLPRRWFGNDKGVFVALARAAGPIEEVDDVRQQHPRRVHRPWRAEVAEAVRRVAQHLTAAIGERGDHVAEQRAITIGHRCRS